MRLLGLSVAVVTAACNTVLGIAPTALVDDRVDTDEDGVIDKDDDCLDVPNPDQADEDRDTFGDLCDSCPMDADADDRDLDGDGVGDACDPHPLDAVDCLLLFDSFGRPDDFAANWLVASGEPAGFVAEQRHVSITAATTGSTLIARANDGAPLVGTYSVHALARTYAPAMSTFALIAGADPAVSELSFRCILSGSVPISTLYVLTDASIGPNSDAGTGTLSSESIVDRLSIRLTASPVATCVVEHGVAVGVGRTRQGIIVDEGRAGIRLSGVAATVEAFALLGERVGGQCPDVIRR